MMQRLFLLVAVLALGACASTFRSDVSTFHTLTGPEGRSFAITPMNPDNSDSIEFARYAASLVQKLEQNGYRPVEEGDEPEVIVGFDVSQSDGREQIYSRPGVGYFGAWHRQFSYYHHWRAFYSYGPYYYGGSYGRELDARTVYPTTLFVEIRKLDGEKVFEGRAITDARTRALPRTIPLLAEALFADFPGPDGETRTVRLELDKEGQIVSERISKAKQRRSRY